MNAIYGLLAHSASVLVVKVIFGAQRRIAILSMRIGAVPDSKTSISTLNVQSGTTNEVAISCHSLPRSGSLSNCATSRCEEDSETVIRAPVGEVVCFFTRA